MRIYNNTSGSTGRNITTSKGNQLKYRAGDKWYKADFLGYEGAAEYFVSELLHASSVQSFVRYDLTNVEYHGQQYNGCVSDNFLREEDMLVTAEKLFKIHQNQSVEKVIQHKSLRDKIQAFVTNIEEMTGLREFGSYLTTLLELDRLTLNEDRHFRNIAVIQTANGFDYCPVFDNGAAFLSDLREDYPLEKSVHGLLPTVKAKPFNSDFDQQVIVAQGLYGKQLTIQERDMGYAYAHIAEYYGDKIAQRIQTVYEHQLYMLRDEVLVSENTEIEYSNKNMQNPDEQANNHHVSMTDMNEEWGLQQHRKEGHMGIYDNISSDKKLISINGNKSFDRFTLMHMDTPLISIDDKGGEITKVYTQNKHLLPFAFRGKNDIKYTDFYRWAAQRALLLDRDNAKKILNACGVRQDDHYGISRACKMLSIDDCFWIKEENECFADVNLREHSLSTAIEQISLNGDYITLSGEVFSPEFTNHGTYPKCWHREEDGLYLLKKSKFEYESEREVLCSDILDMLQIDHVKYEMTSLKGVCRCRCMTDEKKSRINYGEFEQYCYDTGQDALKYFMMNFGEQFLSMNLVDYLIANIDRHSGNWGLYMDNNTGDIIGPHPLYDHNASFSSGFNENTGSLVIPGVPMKEAAREAQQRLQLDLSVLSDIPRYRFEDLGIDHRHFLNRIKDVQQYTQIHVQDDPMQKALVQGYVNSCKMVAAQLQIEMINGVITEENMQKKLEDYIYAEVPKQYREMVVTILKEEGYFSGDGAASSSDSNAVSGSEADTVELTSSGELSEHQDEEWEL